MPVETCQQILESLETDTNVTVQQIIEACSGTDVFQGRSGDVLFKLTEGAIGGAIVGPLFFLGIALMLLFMLGVYIYTSLAWHIIAKKLKHPHPWLSWIPIAGWALQLQLGGFSWLWIFLILIPILGWIALFILLIVSKWFIYEKRKYPGWFSLAVVIPKVGGVLHLIAIGFIAWADKETEKHHQIQIRRTKKPRSRRTKKI